MTPARVTRRSSNIAVSAQPTMASGHHCAMVWLDVDHPCSVEDAADAQGEQHDRDPHGTWLHLGSPFGLSLAVMNMSGL